MRLIVRPAARALNGRYRPPGDKSVSHRAAILGGLAGGETEIHGFLDSADTHATLSAMQQLGARVEESNGVIRMRGGSLRSPTGPLDLGNSGTGMRLLAGALAGHPDLQESRIELIGDASLSRRPMSRIIDPLALMGARIDSQESRAPLVIEPSPLNGRRHALNVASAQVKSAILLAGLNAEGETVVVEPGVSRDHTERMLPAFGASLHDGDPGVAIHGGQSLSGCRIDVPGDLSSAAFALAAGLMVEGSEIELDGVGLNPTRSGVIEVVQAMGAGLVIEGDQTEGGEPLGRLTVSASSISGVDIAPELVPLAIDEFPLIMALAAAADGRTRIRGASELRVKESDRIAVMCRELARLGVELEELDDGAIITGGRIHGGNVDSHGDHRVAMSLAVLGLVAEGPVTIDNAEWIRTSYPGFVDDMRALGAEMEWE
ncbi:MULTISPECIES: 3-phosphoshikimate 1-carboxyvinyltransferase [unclassified Wenzhouxiangella]|uniref:3-phosphoshikimate 1-carboxyvinyltransferase n=1 Tax=unclassified Wenzhouxiangella TaxID=2613841 RepID=UPI000E3264B4|nr:MULTISPECIES: 3-phosphoshikimate 1-carboxyvinyltransferase [unclassified Wenzhouxiangella]RFF26373.1 3-phosphoshikimate 1-carboxyvinyltransferase [Wenzhouxiangella sp. 15181]RFP67355.1 3-phosphoshikimate 1-carboxyvinyltransferase [Wenzhouxiangella sp. 15190]